MKINVVDFYDDTPEIIGVANSMSEAAAIRTARIEDTDGECYVMCFAVQNKGYRDVTDLVEKMCPDMYF